MSHPDITRAEGGRTPFASGGSVFDPNSDEIDKDFEPIGDEPPPRVKNNIGLYSKAAEVARSLTQKVGTADQFISAIRNIKGVKPAEIENAQPLPTGKISKEELAKHFQNAQPPINVVRLGDDPLRQGSVYTVGASKEPYVSPHRLTAAEQDEYDHLSRMQFGTQTPEDQDREEELFHRVLQARIDEGHHSRLPNETHDSAKYGGYRSDLRNSSNYREHLLTLPPGHLGNKQYQSSHWDAPNVVAHVRMQDKTEMERPLADMSVSEMHGIKSRINKHRIANGLEPLMLQDISNRALQNAHDDGIISKEEAYKFAAGDYDNRRRPYADELEKEKGKILHVDEIQSDWAQAARKLGFEGGIDDNTMSDEEFADIRNQLSDFRQRTSEQIRRENPELHHYHVWDDVEDIVRNHPTYGPMQQRVDEYMENTFGNPPPPKGPYVQNTQHWVDLALKHVFNEAARGGYDAVQFANGKENSDRYDMGNHFDDIHYDPAEQSLFYRKVGNEAEKVEEKVPKEKLPDYIGQELADKLLDTDPYILDGISLEKSIGSNPVHSLFGADLSVPNKGMKAFYDNLIPKSAMKIIQQHDPSIRPEKNKDEKGVERFTLRFTPKARQAILRGQTAFASGGAVLPTEAQKAAGNYRKRHVKVHGLDISIETEKGAERSGVSDSGKPWSVKMPADYGYIKGTTGADGDHVDVYLGPDLSSTSVFVVDQKDLRTGKFDEHKALLGFNSLDDAKRTYIAGFSDGHGSDRMGKIARLTIQEFKSWLRNHDTTKPIRHQNAIDTALSVARDLKRGSK